MRIHPGTIYLTDNGAAYCGEHLGMTAKATGRDLSGQPIYPVSPAEAREYPSIRCERCGKAPSLLVAV